jgi:hypothetical protein
MGTDYLDSERTSASATGSFRLADGDARQPRQFLFRFASDGRDGTTLRLARRWGGEHSTVDDKGGTGNETRFVAGEEQHGGGDLLWGVRFGPAGGRPWPTQWRRRSWQSSCGTSACR